MCGDARSYALPGVPGYSSSSGPCCPMPLTIAHAALAWPISRRVRRLPVVPLVIGTLIPDAVYLIDLAPGRSVGHSIFGIMTAGLPLTLVLWWFYEIGVKPTMLRRLPNQVRISGSLLASFGSLPQDLSTVAGLAALAALTYRWANAHPRGAWSLPPDERRRLVKELVFAATVMSLVVAWGVIRTSSAGPRHVLGAASVSAMAGAVLSIALVVTRDHLRPCAPRPKSEVS